MLNHSCDSLLVLLKDYGSSNYSGQATCEGKRGQLMLWFVRGHLVHAHSQHVGAGWDALRTAAMDEVVVISENPESLPPERSIRVSLSRLIKSLEEEHRDTDDEKMYIPVPLHARLESKFKELQSRIRGLSDIKAYSTVSADNGSDSQSNASESSSEPHERILIELGPRGATWTHYAKGEEVLLKGDATMTTSELMRAGEELISELRVMRGRGVDK